VTGYVYNAAGWVQDVLDPRVVSNRPLDTQTLYDALGRTVKSIRNYTNNPETAQADVATEYGYDGSGHVTLVQADQPGGTSEQTSYSYGVSPAGGSPLTSNDLLASVQHPDLGAGHGSQQDSYSWNALGQALGQTDRNGTTHQYSYDPLGRPTADAVTTLVGVDGSVRRIGYGYDGEGNTALVTSYSAATGGSIVNQVQRGYNGLGQLTAESQYHGDPAQISPGVVGYAYTELANGANNSRLLSLTYPNGRVLYDNYAAGLDSSISRLTSLSDNADGTGVLESYRYLGLDTVVERDHPQMNINQTYLTQSGGTGDGGDKYVGLDRFGRVVDQNWYNTGSGGALEEYGYGYDRGGNRLYRQDLQHSGSDDLYTYDGLSQLATFQRGMLNASHTGLTGAASHSQVWTPDALGNFTQVQTDGQTQPPVQTYNQQNELTAIGTAALSYDNNGNLISDASTSPTSTYSYDAWDRLVGASTPGGGVSRVHAYPVGRK
jgi:YD repeat-containing protein